MDKITEALDRGEPADVVFLDFAKAFDKVPVARLLEKVKAHGIRGNVLRWIRSWLTDRQQRVVLNGNFSEWMAVLSGVPQGSVLGPLLFIIFINDLDEEIPGGVMVSKFADDTKVARTVATEEGRAELQEALRKLELWAARWGMEFNILKCKVMHFGRNNPRHDYTMNGRLLEKTEEERDLGVVTNDHGQHKAGGTMRKGGPDSPSCTRPNSQGISFQGQGDFPGPLQAIHKATPGILSAGMGTVVPERQGHAGECAKKGCQDDLRAERRQL